MLYVGADICRAGWLAVTLSPPDGWQVAVFADIFGLWDSCKDARLILLDVPIGLPHKDKKERACDAEARKLLKSRRSSVFPAPSRDAVYAYAKSYEEASQINARTIGKKLSRQSFGLITRIRQVDQLLSNDAFARSCIKETHPEVCFWALNGYRPMRYAKKGPAGFSERIEVLGAVFAGAGEIVDFALSEFRRSRVARDDILDALAAAVTASAVEKGLTPIPQEAEFDARGLPMEMVYYPADLG